jgi:hypothetical protein
MERVGLAVAVFVAEEVGVGVCRCVGDVVALEDSDADAERVPAADALEELVTEGE